MFSIKPVYIEDNYQIEENLLETENFKSFIAGKEICLLVKKGGKLDIMLNSYKYEIFERKEDGIYLESSKPVEIIQDLDDRFKVHITHQKYNNSNSREKKECKNYTMIVSSKKLIDELSELIKILRIRRGW